ncbi:glycosyltransferase family 2 protein [Planctomycetota bacterium]|nr:glycosyltransferase family 2 protein [Planctomycetota bacterium]
MNLSDESKPETELAARVLIIVPAYNESGAIASVVNDLLAADQDLHVLVVDDGSTDDTFNTVPSDARVTALRLPFNLGIGGAVQTGYRYAALHGYDIAIQVDGDGQHPPTELHKLIAQMVKTNADMVVGSRFLPGSGDYNVPTSRKSAINLLNGLIRILTGGKRVTDCTSGFRAVNKRSIQALAHWYPEDYPEPEIIVAMHRAGFVIDEVPVDMNQREHGTSSISFIDGLFYVLKVGTALVLTTIREPWPKMKASDN